jgi:ASPIC and UnbV
VLSDPTRPKTFRQSNHWRSPLLNFQLRVKQDRPVSLGDGDGPAWRSNSFSGHERNRFLLAVTRGFFDLSLLSGADCREDARSFAMLDFDNDGWLDIALMSTNAPRFRLFRNRIGTLTRGGRVLTLDLEGGNRTSAAGEFGNRDAVGTLVTAVTSAGRRVYRRSLGEGLASQNAAGLRLTFAPGEKLVELQIHWPSGRTSTHTPAPDATTMVIVEPKE